MTLLHGSSQPTAEVLGYNCRRVRTAIGVTQDELARHARDVGLKWNAAKVANFEAGRWAPTFATVLAVTLALQKAWKDREKSGEPPTIKVTLSELVHVRGGWIALNDTLDVVGAELADVCSGDVPEIGPRQIRKRGAPAPQPYDWDRRMRDISAVLERSGLTEDRLARRLGIGRARLADESSRLWRRTFSEERDRRAGPGANQQKKGRISRELRAELEKAIAHGKN
jgi:transcriptional regulator with XRE-family HTH domain